MRAARCHFERRCGRPASCAASGRARASGETYRATACNGDTRATGRAVDAGSYIECEGGFPGLFDMSGSLDEWEDGCEPGDAGSRFDICASRGGAFYSNAGGLRCDVITLVRRDYADSDCDLAIRCCADLPWRCRSQLGGWVCA